MTPRAPGTSTLLPVKTFESLFAELSEKAVSRPAGSGTVAELDAGVHAIGKKIVEEAAEVWMAAEHEGNEAELEKGLSSLNAVLKALYEHYAVDDKYHGQYRQHIGGLRG